MQPRFLAVLVIRPVAIHTSRPSPPPVIRGRVMSCWQGTHLTSGTDSLALSNPSVTRNSTSERYVTGFAAKALNINYEYGGEFWKDKSNIKGRP
jgi:hypothetical protein